MNSNNSGDGYVDFKFQFQWLEEAKLIKVL